MISAKQIRRWRMEADMTPEEFAAAVCTSAPTLRRWESGDATPNLGAQRIMRSLFEGALPSPLGVRLDCIEKSLARIEAALGLRDG